jgi:hypothetical protein
MKSDRPEHLPKFCSYCKSGDVYFRSLFPPEGYGQYFSAESSGFPQSLPFDVVVCTCCGLTQVFAGPMVCASIKENRHWEHV